MRTTPVLRDGRKAKKEPELIRKVVTLSKRDKLSEERTRSHRKASLALGMTIRRPCPARSSMALTTRSGVMLVVMRGVRVRTSTRDGQAEPVSSLVIWATTAAKADRSNKMASDVVAWVLRQRVTQFTSFTVRLVYGPALV
jgi:hypothetical protein